MENYKKTKMVIEMRTIQTEVIINGNLQRQQQQMSLKKGKLQNW